MVKNLDQAIYRSLDDAYNDNWTAGTKALGLAENGVGWSLDEHNENLITIEMKTEVEAVKNLIISGEIQVHDFMNNNHCDDTYYIKPGISVNVINDNTTESGGTALFTKQTN